MEKKILVVDNDMLILSMMSDLLEEDGHQVVTASDGLSALDVLKTYTPDVIFIDLIMPNIDGHKLCSIIRRNPALKDSYVVILSAVAEEEKKVLSRIGADAYIAKGPMAEMARHIHTLLEQWEQKSSQRTPEEIRGFGATSPRVITQELLSIKNHFEIILGSMSEGIIEVNSDNRVIYVNPSAVSLLGIDAENLLGMNFFEFFTKPGCEKIKNLMTSIRAGHKTIGEKAPLNLDGKLVTLDLLPVNGNGEKAIVVLNDVTERKHAEEELKKYHEHLEDLVRVRTVELQKEITERKRTEENLKNERNRLQQYLDIAGIIFLVLNNDQTVALINRKGCEILGYPEKEIIGKDWFGNFMPKQSSGEAAISFQKLISGEIDLPENDEGVVITSSGEQRIIAWHNKALVDDEGRITGILCSGEDITDRKMAEKEKKKLEAILQQDQKMKAIGTLAGGVSHDFNNLLMGIQGQASLMMLTTDSDHPHYRYLKLIEELVEKGAALTGQLLGFARKGKYEVKPTDLNGLIEKTLDMFGRTNREIIIHKTYEKNIWTAEVDRSQIEEMLLNLYINAKQAMPEGGALYLKTENIILDEHYIKPFKIEPGNYVRIMVTDTGVGMNEETKQRIFEPFFTTKKNGWGSGLGLASSYGIIKNHGGFINVYSEQGRGSTFTIYIPASEKAAAKDKAIERQVKAENETLLVVDDEELILEVAQKLLESLGYKVLIARSGKEAMEVYRQEKDSIELVVLDMIMPEMGGEETYAMLKKINPAIKVLLSSGYSIDGQANEILNRGCDGFIQKPFNMKQLSEKLRQILDKK